MNARTVAKTTNAENTTNVARGESHHRSWRNVRASMRARVGLVTPRSVVAMRPP